MNTFINIRDGLVNATSYRPSDCIVTTLDDLMTEALAGSNEDLTASFDLDEFLQHPEALAFLEKYGNTLTCRAGASYEFADVQFTVGADDSITAEG